MLSEKVIEGQGDDLEILRIDVVDYVYFLPPEHSLYFAIVISEQNKVRCSNVKEKIIIYILPADSEYPVRNPTK